MSGRGARTEFISYSSSKSGISGGRVRVAAEGIRDSGNGSKDGSFGMFSLFCMLEVSRGVSLLVVVLEGDQTAEREGNFERAADMERLIESETGCGKTFGNGG